LLNEQFLIFITKKCKFNRKMNHFVKDRSFLSNFHNLTIIYSLDKTG